MNIINIILNNMMNRHQVGIDYLPYTNNIYDSATLKCNIVQKPIDEFYFNYAKKADDVNHHYLNMGLATGTCGQNGNESRICPKAAVCNNNKKCERVVNYLDLSTTNNVFYRECMNSKDKNCVANYYGDKAILRN
jgi:hypothetical protein